MRAALIVLALSAVVSSFGATQPQRDAAAVLRDMRQAIGVEAMLDGFKGLSMTAVGEIKLKGLALDVADEYFMLMPDHYLRVRRPRVARSGGDSRPLKEGFRGDRLIRPLGGHTPPEVLHEGDRLALAKWRHDAARLILALTGTALPSYPMTFTAAGTEEAGGSTYEIVESRSADGVVMRLFVDTTTHLPAMVATTGLEKTPDTRWFVSSFKKTAGLNWPTSIEEQTDVGISEMVTVKAWRLNPRIDARVFDPK